MLNQAVPNKYLVRRLLTDMRNFSTLLRKLKLVEDGTDAFFRDVIVVAMYADDMSGTAIAPPIFWRKALRLAMNAASKLEEGVR